ncbi:hypothetical protein DFS33DRAFT_977438 [Desarmillaria ectypa]|nr:hypothetical protein DFS33DRAFT_977438 [Desarmillaria ectypa]
MFDTLGTMMRRRRNLTRHSANIFRWRSTLSRSYNAGGSPQRGHRIYWHGRFQLVKEPCSIFETTIRYLGGLLSVYELRGNKDDILLHKEQEIADKLAFAWVGDNDSGSDG